MSKLTDVQEFRLKLYPKNFATVRAFYKDELGYRIVHEWDHAESKGVMFDVGGTILELLWPGNGTTTDYRADVSWQVPDVWSLYKTKEDKPCIIRGLQDNAWGDTSFHIQDPEGFKITFFTKTEQKDKHV